MTWLQNAELSSRIGNISLNRSSFKACPSLKPLGERFYILGPEQKEDKWKKNNKKKTEKKLIHERKKKVGQERTKRR